MNTTLNIQYNCFLILHVSWTQYDNRNETVKFWSTGKGKVGDHVGAENIAQRP